MNRLIATPFIHSSSFPHNRLQLYGINNFENHINAFSNCFQIQIFFIINTNLFFVIPAKKGKTIFSNVFYELDISILKNWNFHLISNFLFFSNPIYLKNDYKQFHRDHPKKEVDIRSIIAIIFLL
jgi:hypothetical protein